MPKIFNTSWGAVLLATLAFYIVGFVWYAFLFQEIYLAASGLTAEQTEQLGADKGIMMLV